LPVAGFTTWYVIEPASIATAGQSITRQDGTVTRRPRLAGISGMLIHGRFNLAKDAGLPPGPPSSLASPVCTPRLDSVDGVGLTGPLATSTRAVVTRSPRPSTSSPAGSCRFAGVCG
jgi:hypothetical protein